MLWFRGRDFAAGVTLSLLLTKPHYGLVILVFVALARGWRVLAGAFTGTILLVLTTVPLGWDTWKAWMLQARSAASAIVAVPGWKQITVRATWTSLLAPAHPDLATALWLGTAVPAMLLATWAGWRAGAVRDLRGRVVGLAVLSTLACGPYAFHYDGLLLAIPGLVWCFQPWSYRSPGSHRLGGIAILATYTLQQIDGWILQRGVALTGLSITAWLVLDAVDLLRHPPIREGEAAEVPLAATVGVLPAASPLRAGTAPRRRSSS
jgi:hypothetical protein